MGGTGKKGATHGGGWACEETGVGSLQERTGGTLCGQEARRKGGRAADVGGADARQKESSAQDRAERDGGPQQGASKRGGEKRERQTGTLRAGPSRPAAPTAAPASSPPCDRDGLCVPPDARDRDGSSGCRPPPPPSRAPVAAGGQHTWRGARAARPRQNPGRRSLPFPPRRPTPLALRGQPAAAPAAPAPGPRQWRARRYEYGLYGRAGLTRRRGGGGQGSINQHSLSTRGAARSVGQSGWPHRQPPPRRAPLTPRVASGGARRSAAARHTRRRPLATRGDHPPIHQRKQRKKRKRGVVCQVVGAHARMTGQPRQAEGPPPALEGRRKGGTVGRPSRAAARGRQRAHAAAVTNGPRRYQEKSGAAGDGTTQDRSASGDGRPTDRPRTWPTRRRDKGRGREGGRGRHPPEPPVWVRLTRGCA